MRMKCSSRHPAIIVWWVATICWPAFASTPAFMSVSGTYSNVGAIVVPLKNSPNHIAPLAGLLAGASVPKNVHSVQLTHDPDNSLSYAFFDAKGVSIGAGEITSAAHALHSDKTAVSFQLEQRNAVEGGRSRAEQIVTFRREPRVLFVELRIVYEVVSLGLFRSTGNDYALYRFELFRMETKPE